MRKSIKHVEINSIISKGLLRKKYYYQKFKELKGNLKLSWKLNEIINENKFKTELPDHFKDNNKIISEPTEIADV